MTKRETVPVLLALVSRIVSQIEANASLCWYLLVRLYYIIYYNRLHYHTRPHDIVVEGRLAG